MYGIFNIALDSDIPLPELPEVELAKSIIRIQAGEDASCIPAQPEWFHHWETPEGEVSILCAKLTDAYLLRFPKLVDFTISMSCDTVLYFAKPDIPVATIRHLLLDQVVPRILGQRGYLILHASAVVMPGGQAIAFLGHSGRGKSTLASSFHHHGARLITDDCLLLEEVGGHIVAIPNYYGLRLFTDSATAIFGEQSGDSPVAHYTTKKRLQLSSKGRADSKAASRLTTVFLLADAGEDGEPLVRINKVKGIETIMTMIEQSFLLDITDKPLIARQFTELGRFLSSGINIYQLIYPRQHAMLPQVRSKIEEIL